MTLKNMGFLANMSSIINKSAEKALKIAPHLVNILQTIVGFRSRFDCFHFESIYDILNPHLLNCKFRNEKVKYEVYCDIYKNIMECLHVIQNGIEKLGLFHEEVTELFGYRTRSDERDATNDQMLSPYAPIGFTSPFLSRGALKIDLFLTV